MVRFALIGCAAAGLAWSAAAQAEEPLSQQAPAATDASATPPKVKRVPRKVAVLPPARPVLEPAELPGIAIQEVAAAAAPVEAAPETVPPRIASISVLPPLRPSMVDAAPAAEPNQPEPASAEIQGVAPPPRPDFAEVPAPPMTIVAVLPPERPAFAADASLMQATPAPEPQPAPPRSLFGALFGQPIQPGVPNPATPVVIRTGHDFLDERIAHHALLNDVPATLVHRVVVRESKYNPRAVGRGGALGLMQIKHATARGLGYDGPATGLLDAEINLTYAVKYLAGAYRLADGNHDRAVQHYARGYYYEAKRRNSRVALRSRNERPQRQADAAAALDQIPGLPPAPRSLFLNTR